MKLNCADPGLAVLGRTPIGKGSRLLLLVAAVVVLAGQAAAWRKVAVDQQGYARLAHKYVFVTAAADSFTVVDLASGVGIYRGELTEWKTYDESTGQNVYRGDFSSCQIPGRFRIATSQGDSSAPFLIADSVYEEVFRKSLKGFYFQRCGMQLAPSNAGLYQHPACHLLDGVFHVSTDTSGFHAATGGWHDAGDFGKYVVNAGISVGTLLLAYEMFPAEFAIDESGIPESGNGVPDILDEARYELEWILKMQRGDGAVWFKVTHEQFEPFIMPQADTGPRYLYELSSAATGDAAAVLARAARIFGPFDQSFAGRCLDGAQLAWEFLKSHPSIIPPGGFTNPPGTATGEYGDADDSDERLWAAAELFETTGDSAYNTSFFGGYLSGPSLSYAMWWGDVRPLALVTYLCSRQAAAIPSVKAELLASLDSYCTAMVARRNDSGYHVILFPGDYVWGSNSGALNGAVLLLAGYARTGKKEYLDVAADQLHYVLGVNGYARSYVTGVGENPPLHPHHRPSAADGIADPVPGLLAGGPDQYRDDAILQALFTASTPPALCYADSLPSYASNEICINWNAPLVFVAGCLRGGAGPSAVRESRIGRPDGFRLEQNYPDPFNPTTTIEYNIGGVVASTNIRLVIYDILGREVTTLVNEVKQPGHYQVRFDGSRLASGVYFYALAGNLRAGVRRMLLLK